ncbi:MAG: CRISPR-associated endonuclease Cas6, partial [Saprospiraceae bacterium]
DCEPEQAVQVKIQQVQRERWVSFKGVKVLAFSLEFSANVALPSFIGLGKGCSVGWGVVKGLRGNGE